MTTRDDARPLLAIGHVLLRVADIAGAAEYFRKIGMRVVETTDDVAVLELRGGTHVVLLPAEGAIEPGTSAPFDLMVDDLESIRTDWKANGMRTSSMDRYMTRSRLRDPTVTSSPSILHTRLVCPCEIEGIGLLPKRRGRVQR